jgi:hypothetical protein
VNALFFFEKKIVMVALVGVEVLVDEFEGLGAGALQVADDAQAGRGEVGRRGAEQLVENREQVDQLVEQNVVLLGFGVFFL